VTDPSTPIIVPDLTGHRHATRARSSRVEHSGLGDADLDVTRT
jgi:hypothetical protein